MWGSFPISTSFLRNVEITTPMWKRARDGQGLGEASWDVKLAVGSWPEWRGGPRSREVVTKI